jgi:hypothetical protein
MPKGSSIFRVLVACLTAAAALCVSPSVASASTKPGTCKVTGDGTLGNGAYFAISVNGTQATYDSNGHATLITDTGYAYRFTVIFVFCGHDGGGGPGAPGGDGLPNIANAEGPGISQDGVPVYFATTIHDHGEGCSSQPINCDEWATTVTDATQTTVLYHAAGRLISGNMQIQTNGS